MENNKWNKQKTTVVVLVVLLALSVSYVAWDIAGKIRVGLFWQGYELAVREIIREAKNKECRPFSVFTEEERVELINIECLQESTEGMEELMMEELLTEDPVDSND